MVLNRRLIFIADQYTRSEATPTVVGSGMPSSNFSILILLLWSTLLWSASFTIFLKDYDVVDVFDNDRSAIMSRIDYIERHEPRRSFLNIF